MATTVSHSGDRRIFHTLDLLRGIAAAAVVGRHLEHGLQQIFPSSQLAVDLFFVLSGFVISYAYEQRLRDGMDSWGFMVRRLIRLYPLYCLGILFGALLLVVRLLLKRITASPDAAVESLLSGLFFIPATAAWSWDKFHIFPFNPPSWSLFWELVINLVFAWVARGLSNRVLSAILVVGVGLLTLSIYLYGTLDGGSNFHTFPEGFFRVVYSFFMGIAVYRLWASGRFAWVRVPSWLSALLLIAIMAVRPAAEGVYDLLIVLFAFPLLVLASTQEPSARFKPVCVQLGLASYPMYALHWPFARVALEILIKLGSHAKTWGLLLEIAFVLFMIAFALFVDRLVDRPVRRWLSRKVSVRD